MPKELPIFDFDQPAMRTTACTLIKNLRGKYQMELKRCKDQRSLNQNAYYWGVVLPRVAAGVQDAWGETLTSEDAHELCRRAFLTRTLVNRTTGEVMSKVPRSTASLDTAEFAEYLEQIIRFAADHLNTEIPEAMRVREPAST